MNSSLAARHLIFWPLCGAGLAADLATKAAAFAVLPSHAECRPVLGSLLVLRRAENTGTFFGLGSQGGGSNTALIIFTVLMMAVVLAMFLVPSREASRSLRLYNTGLGLVFAGAAGNLWDRIVHDFVRDFIDIGIGASRWPTFNLADVWLTVGIGIYLVALLRAGRMEARPEEKEAAAKAKARTKAQGGAAGGEGGDG
jgi:signal peptidase II